MANALLDFLQGASNSAAANVSAPVDGIAWLLRKAGINVDRPVMGSDWMRERGLTAEPTNKLAGILGESVGGVLPMVTAAKAPQIAQGLLQAERNLAAPRTLNPQTGAILWHGSPHKFDAFDSSKIGTGEGNQAYGHGLYLADSADVADTYARTVAGQKIRDSIGYKKASDRNAISSAIDYFTAMKQGQVPRDVKNGSAVNDAYISSQLDGLRKELASHDAALGASPQLYKVDLPDEHIAKMLDWDKPLSEQPNIRGMIPKELENILSTSKDLPWTYGKKAEEMTGQDLVRSMAGLDGTYSGVSEVIKKQGIPGIRYLDGGSRGTGAGTSNYVVFPGNEGLLSILERNGQPLK